MMLIAVATGGGTSCCMSCSEMRWCCCSAGIGDGVSKSMDVIRGNSDDWDSDDVVVFSFHSSVRRSIISTLMLRM